MKTATILISNAELVAYTRDQVSCADEIIVTYAKAGGRFFSVVQMSADGDYWAEDNSVQLGSFDGCTFELKLASEGEGEIVELWQFKSPPGGGEGELIRLGQVIQISYGDHIENPATVEERARRDRWDGM